MNSIGEPRPHFYALANKTPAYSLDEITYRVSNKNNPQFFLNNCSKSKHIFTISGAQYPDDTFYRKCVKFALKIYSQNAIVNN